MADPSCSLWTLKLCILDFYSRFVDVLRYGKLATTILWWFIVATFVGVLVVTLTECQPLSLCVTHRPAARVAEKNAIANPPIQLLDARPCGR